MGKPSLAAQISEVERELALRKNVYARRVSGGQMKQGEAELHTAYMEGVLRTLRWVQTNEATLRAAVKAAGGESEA